MSSLLTIQTYGDWARGVEIGLQSALEASVDVGGKDGEGACRQALHFMAQSAGKIAKRSPKMRDVVRDLKNRAFVWVLKGSRLHRRLAGGGNQFAQTKGGAIAAYKDALTAEGWSKIKRISTSGLAAKSWVWGLSGIGKASGRKPIPGSYKLYSVGGGNDGGSAATALSAGYVLENRMRYINAAMPSGWEASVERSAINRVMGQSARRIERDMGRAMEGNGMRRQVARGGIKRHFKQVA